MKAMINTIISGAGIKAQTEDFINKINENMESNGVESIEDLKILTQNDISNIFTLPKVQVIKIFMFIKDYGEDSEEPESYELPTLPTNFGTISGIEITGNKNIDLEVVNNFIEFGLLYGMGTETMGIKLTKLMKSRMEDLDVPATVEVIKAYKVAAKFEQFDQKIAGVLDFELSMLASRHDMANEIMDYLAKDIITFVNDALEFRLELSDINTLILQRIPKARVGSDITGELLLTSAEELAIRISKRLRGLNSLIVKESLKLYKELFEIINDTDLQKFLGVNDTKDLLNKLNVQYTPKDVKAFQKVPELIYQMLFVLSKPEILNNDKFLYKYLQNVWANGKTLDWAKFGALSSKKVQNNIVGNLRGDKVSSQALPIIEELLD